MPTRLMRLQITGEVRTAYSDADAILPLRQRPYHVPAEEPRAAENSDQGFGMGFWGHGRLASPALTPRHPPPYRPPHGAEGREGNA